MKKYTITQVGQVIENEGIGYAIQSYMSADKIADPELAALWLAADAALSAVTDYIEAHADPDEDDEWGSGS